MNIISVLSFALYIALACRLSMADDTNNSCTRNDGLPGNCKPLRDCPKILEFVSRINLISETEKEYIRNSRCPVHKRRYVCCEEEKESEEEVSEDEVSEEEELSEGVKILLQQDCGRFGIFKKTIGGYGVKLMSRPWMALLKFRRFGIDEFTCGGTLISSRFVLTAAHCFNNGELLFVRLGEHQISSTKDCRLLRRNQVDCAPPVEDIPFEENFLHESYSRKSGGNDIALVKLSRDVVYGRSISPICLPLNKTLQKEPEDMVEFHVTGWGKTETHPLSDFPMETIVTNRNRTDCQMYFRREVKLSQLCAGNLGHDSCNGDSGGPLAYITVYNDSQRFVQYGIVSYGAGDCGNGYPGVYTNVGAFIPWIADKLIAN